MRAVGLVVVEHLAVEALNAFVRVDIALGVNRLHRAIVGATLAGVAAHRIAAQPVKHPQARRNGQGRAQRAQIAAIKALDKQTGQKQHQRKRHKPPFTHKFQNHRGFKRLHFRQFFRQAQFIKRHTEKQHKNHIFQRCQPRVHAVRHINLAHTQLFGDAVEQFLQSAKRAKPAAKCAAVPKQNRNRRGAPQNKHQRIHQEIFP